jgi:hypothetical protein
VEIAGPLKKSQTILEGIGGIVAAGSSYLPLIGTKLFAINPKIINDTWGIVLFAIPAAGLTSYVLTRLPTPRRLGFLRRFAVFVFWSLGLVGLIIFLVSAGWLSALRRDMLAPDDPSARALLARYLFVATFVGLAICIGWGVAHLIRIGSKRLRSTSGAAAPKESASGQPSPE